MIMYVPPRGRPARNVLLVVLPWDRTTHAGFTAPNYKHFVAIIISRAARSGGWVSSALARDFSLVGAGR